MKKLVCLMLLLTGCLSPRFQVARSSVFYVKINGMGGTAFAARSGFGRTVIVTNEHICRESVDGKVSLSQDNLGISEEAEIIYASSLYDICLLKAPRNIEPIPLADSVSLAETVYIVGHPKLKPLTITSGEITDRDMAYVGEGQGSCPVSPNFKSVPTFMGDMCVGQFNAYVSSAHSEPGNSGSPVLNEAGQVVGVLFAGSDAASLIVPLEYLKLVLSMF